MTTFEEALTRYVESLRQILIAMYTNSGWVGYRPVLKVEEGPRAYVRIVQIEEGCTGCALVFVDSATGQVFVPHAWLAERLPCRNVYALDDGMPFEVRTVAMDGAADSRGTFRTFEEARSYARELAYAKFKRAVVVDLGSPASADQEAVIWRWDSETVAEREAWRTWYAIETAKQRDA